MKTVCLCYTLLKRHDTLKFKLCAVFLEHPVLVVWKGYNNVLLCFRYIIIEKEKKILIVKELQLKQSCSIIMGTLKHAELHRTRVLDLNSSLI